MILRNEEHDRQDAHSDLVYIPIFRCMKIISHRAHRGHRVVTTSVPSVCSVAIHCSIAAGGAAGELRMMGSVIDAARLPHMAVRQRSLDDLVAEQCEDPTAQEEWARIAVPVHARGSAPVIRRSILLRGESSYFFQAQHIIAQEQDGRRSVDQMPVAGTTAPADREAEQSG